MMIHEFERRRSPVSRRSIAYVMLCITIFTSCSLGSRGENRQTTKITTLYPTVQGLYESCPIVLGSRCLERLKQMAAAGFTLIVNYDQLYGAAEQQRAYGMQARSLGMKVIWALDDPALWNGTDLRNRYKDLAATCNCSDNNGFVRYFVNLVKNLPATWGYYVGDEVKEKDHAVMKAFANFIKQLDPYHPRLFVSGEDSSTMGANLVPFVDTAEVIGSDIYPISTTESISVVGDISRVIQSMANQNGKQSMVVLQSFNWGEYPQATWVCSPFPGCARFPTMAEMRQIRDLALENLHPQFVLWYSYFDILRSDNPSSHWEDLVKAASAT